MTIIRECMAIVICALVVILPKFPLDCKHCLRLVRLLGDETTEDWIRKISTRCRRRFPKAPRCCGLPVVVVLVTLLATPQLASTNLLNLQASFHRLEQTKTRHGSNRQGGNADHKAQHTFAARRQEEFPRSVLFSTESIQADTRLNPHAATSNPTNYWLASKLMNTSRSSPISSLVPGCNPPKAQLLALAESWLTGTSAALCQTSSHGNSSIIIRIPTQGLSAVWAPHTQQNNSDYGALWTCLEGTVFTDTFIRVNSAL